jgi:hypothetical protein
MHLTMLWAHFSLNTGIQWHTIVRHYLILLGNTPPMTRKCIPMYKPIVNENITLWGQRRSYKLITSLYSSYRHRENCRMTAIKSGPPTCNNSISTSSIRHVSPIVLLIALVDLLWLHLPLCSIPVDMKHQSGPNFTNKIQTSPPHIISWVQMPLSLIFTFRMDYYATWAISVFLQVSMQS